MRQRIGVIWFDTNPTTLSSPIAVLHDLFGKNLHNGPTVLKSQFKFPSNGEKFHYEMEE